MRKAEKNGFPGGVHPTDGYDKALTMDLPVREYQPDTVAVLAEQSFGAKCGITVKAGSHVTEGERIGEPEAFMAAPLHASVTGTVVDVREVANRGGQALACIIKREQAAAAPAGEYLEKTVDISELSKEGIVAALENGGLTGMGGAGFPTHKKYVTKQTIDALLINAAECEPFLTCDYRLMLEYSHAVVNGVRALKKAAGAKTAYLCIEDNKMEAVQKLREIVNYLPEEEGVEVCVLPTKYPQGGERQLIQSVLGREVPQGGLPADVGAIVSNVGTAKAAADMVFGGLPLTRRIVTVTGLVQNPGNYLVPIGTSARELLLACGGVTEKANRIIAGGPMTGPCVAVNWDGEEELFYVTKNTSGILVLADSKQPVSPCIRCGGCAEVCPAGLVPYQIEIALEDEDYELCEQLYAGECIACGCCSYTCPAKRELSVHTAQARNIVKQRIRERGSK